jgi:hypothetical protein
MSGEALALAVGYAKQSAIGNLENRPRGTGGDKIAEIARVLRVPLEWLLSGPDTGEVPYSETTEVSRSPHHHSRAQEPAATTYDASIAEAVDLFRSLNTEQRVKIISEMRRLNGSSDQPRHQDNGDCHPVSQARAA